MISKNINKEHINLHYWVSRWDSMQEYYNPDRKERFASLISLISAKCECPKLILDLGCGTGSIISECLKAFPSAQVIGVDLDVTLLKLAQGRLESLSPRFTIIQTDFRKDIWLDQLSGGFDAIVSATALHWLNKEQLSVLYDQAYQLLNKNGLFLNADHVGSLDESIQNSWKNQKSLISLKKPDPIEPWESFWNDYLNELGEDAKMKRLEALGNWNGIEDGLPLDWHFDKLKIAGFQYVDCFYRYFCDAIYGGIKS